MSKDSAQPIETNVRALSHKESLISLVRAAILESSDSNCLALKQRQDQVENTVTDLTSKINRMEQTTVDTQNKTVGMAIQLGQLSTKMDSLYGNGSGRKGAIENIQDSITKTNERMDIMTKNQAEILETLRIQDVTATVRSKQNNKWITALKWLSGGAAIAAWGLFEHYVLHFK